MNKWLYSTNHKDIGILYFIFAILSGIIGSSIRIIIRIELGSPNSLILNYQTFNTLVIMEFTINQIFIEDWSLIGVQGNRGAYFSSPLSILRDSLTAYKLRAIFHNFWQRS